MCNKIKTGGENSQVKLYSPDLRPPKFNKELLDTMCTSCNEFKRCLKKFELLDVLLANQN